MFTVNQRMSTGRSDKPDPRGRSINAVFAMTACRLLAFLQADAGAGHQTCRHVADQLRPRWPKLAALTDDSEHDVLAYLAFRPRARTLTSSVNHDACHGLRTKAVPPIRISLPPPPTPRRKFSVAARDPQKPQYLRRFLRKLWTERPGQHANFVSLQPAFSKAEDFSDLVWNS